MERIVDRLDWRSLNFEFRRSREHRRLFLVRGDVLAFRRSLEQGLKIPPSRPSRRKLSKKYGRHAQMEEFVRDWLESGTRVFTVSTLKKKRKEKKVPPIRWQKCTEINGCYAERLAGVPNRVFDDFTRIKKFFFAPRTRQKKSLRLVSLERQLNDKCRDRWATFATNERNNGIARTDVVPRACEKHRETLDEDSSARGKNENQR